MKRDARVTLTRSQFDAVIEALIFRLAGEIDSDIPATVYDRALDRLMLARPR